MLRSGSETTATCVVGSWDGWLRALHDHKDTTHHSRKRVLASSSPDFQQMFRERPVYTSVRGTFNINRPTADAAAPLGRMDRNISDAERMDKPFAIGSSPEISDCATMRSNPVCFLLAVVRGLSISLRVRDFDPVLPSGAAGRRRRFDVRFLVTELYTGLSREHC